MVVTSAESGGGHSAVAVNLATLLARAGSRVVLVDADLRFTMRRKPGDGSMSSGFASLLVNQLRTASGAVVHTLEPRLKLLPVGSAACSPATLMHSPRLEPVFEELRGLADYVILEAPPVLSWDGTMQLAQLADTTLLALESGRTSRETARRAAAKLKAADLSGLGVVLDRAPASSVPRIEDGLGAPAPTVSTLAQAGDEQGDERLAIAVRDLLAEVEESLKLIRSIREGREPGLSR
jgi:Mrp family chromosome partitioning ATPase